MTDYDFKMPYFVLRLQFADEPAASVREDENIF
jgi:hypothetical protein